MKGLFLASIRHDSRIFVRYYVFLCPPALAIGRQCRQTALVLFSCFFPALKAWRAQLHSKIARYLHITNTNTSAHARARKHTFPTLIDFVATASAYAKILIEELSLSNEMKTLKPLVGKWGHAGGTKYMANGIYFKFCLDDQQMFGGDDSMAQKVGLCELRGLRSFFSFTGRLCFPLLCVIDCEFSLWECSSSFIYLCLLM